MLSIANSSSGDGTAAVKVAFKSILSWDQRDYIRFTNVKRKKDFACFERVNQKLVNIVDGLELHTGVFSAVEQKRIVDCVYELEERGKKGKLKGRIFEYKGEEWKNRVEDNEGIDDWDAVN